MMMSEAVTLYMERNRYLVAVPDTALSERLVHLMNNCIKLDHESMVQLSATEQPDIFMRLMDVFAETALRHGTVQAGQHVEAWDKSKNTMINAGKEVAEKARKLKSQISENTGNLLFRFSKHEFMKDLVQNGGVFLQSASTYKTQENISVRDDELELTLTRFLSESEAAVVVKALTGPAAMSRARILEYAVSAPDFLTLCFTDAVNYRMISDWDAEAAVIIRDRDEFYRRFQGASKKLQTEKFGLEQGKLRYIDPYFDSYEKVQQQDLPFCKHFKFSYQREYRYVIRNSQNISNNDRKVYLGSLSDIATLVDLR